MSKEKNIKKESKLKKKINEMKQTAKGKAILKLIGWAIFFTLIFIFLGVASLMQEPITNNNTNNNNQDQINEEKDEHIIDIISSDLLKNKYDYKYEITINDSKYTYEGSKDNKIDTGYKTTLEGIEKYYIDETGTYKDTAGEKILNDNLYENINSEYLNIPHIFNILTKDTLVKESVSDDEGLYNYNDELNTYSLSYSNYSENKGYEVKIIIKNDNYTYELSFRNVSSN